MFRLALLSVVLCGSSLCSPAISKQPDCGAGGAVEHSAQLVALRGKPTFRDVVSQAIRESPDLTRIEKLKLRLAMAINPAAREAVEDYLLDVANEGGVRVADADAKIDLDQLERLLQLLIEYLPQIIEIISKLFGPEGQGVSLGAISHTLPVALHEPGYSLSA